MKIIFIFSLLFFPIVNICSSEPYNKIKNWKNWPCIDIFCKADLKSIETDIVNQINDIKEKEPSFIPIHQQL